MGEMKRNFFLILVIICIFGVALFIINYAEKYSLGNQYYYFPDNKHILSIVGAGKKIKPDIPPYVKKIVFDNRYILVEQNPEGVYDCGLYNCPHSYPGSLSDDYSWIIDQSTDVLLGPYLRRACLEACSALSIDSSALLLGTNTKIVNKIKNLSIK